MATTVPTRIPPSSRRPTSASPIPPSPSLAKGATARSAASSRLTSPLNIPAVNRRASLKGVPLPEVASESRELLVASLKEEVDQKEQLLVQVQNRDQTISNLNKENSNLISALNAAETRINDLYAEQSRSEVELAQRIDISEKLRTQVRDLEKEKRDIHRRYNEQTATFEAERQAFYDNEQHLKSRIQSLTQPRKQAEPVTTILEPESESESDDKDEGQRPSHQHPTPPRPDLDDSDTEPPEITSLKLELSTLSTSYSSLQNTLILLQSQLVDLKRVNHELQEENESYMILLREKTLSGQFDLMRQVGGGGSDEDEDEDSMENTDVRSLRSTGRSTLDRVEEELLEDNLEQELEQGLETKNADPRQSSRPGRKRTTSTSSALRGETLADLPITGPGLDLAAELGRAENKDILEGNTSEERDHSIVHSRNKRSRGGLDGRKPSAELGGTELNSTPNDIVALRNEVKSLKDANKALSLYASKIIDRIISQEGFEHVLAVDYGKEPLTAIPASDNIPKSLTTANVKARPQSVIVTRSTSSPMPETKPPSASPNLIQSSSKVQRRSLSFDWKGFSIFNGSDKKPDPNLRPLTLKPGASPVTGGRKLDTQEDEDDRKERERLNATMKLMGIQLPAKQQESPSFSFPTTPTQKTTSISTPATNNNRRFSLFGSRTVENPDAHIMKSMPSEGGNSEMELGIGPNLTREALEHAEAESSLAVLDAQERTLSAEIARGASSGFTEISPRVGGRRSRRSAGGSSGSTVWSAGMSGNGDDD